MPLPSLPATTQRIVAAARRHFFQHGFRGVTMDDLAAEMGMSKKTLYAHFSGKRALLAAVIESKFQELASQMEILPSRPKDFAETLRNLLAVMQDHACEVSPSFVRDISREEPELFEMVRTRRKELIARTFGQLLRQGQASRAIRRDISVDFLVEVLIGTTEAVAVPEKLAAKGVGPGEIIEPLLSIFLEGALTEKGRRQR